MKVLLIQDVDDLGFAGEVKNVATGYGRNFLIANGLAVLATPSALKEAELHRRRAAERRQRLADEVAALAATIGQTTLVFQAKAGEKGRLYGSVTTADIADKLAEAVGQEIDRRKINLDSPIKQLGTHKVGVRLSTDVMAEFDVAVESLEAAEEEAAETEAAVPAEEEAPAVEE
jgi:large subunit ribosomal protein L9